MAKKTKKAATIDERLYYKGVKQIGDASMFNDKNAHSYFTMHEVPLSTVGPCDIVDDVDPKQRYTFYLFRDTGNRDQSATELDRLRRAGYFKCESPRFISPTEKFETRDGVLVLGQGIWYALPESKMARNRKDGKGRGYELVEQIASVHSGFEQRAKAEGIHVTESRTRNDLRGQRIAK